MAEIIRHNAIRQFAVLDVSNKWSVAYKQSVVRTLAGGHIPFIFVFCLNRVSLLLLNIDRKTLCYYISKCEIIAFALYKLRESDEAICEHWALKDRDLPYHIRQNPFVLISSQEQGAELYMPYIEAANMIIADNLEAMIQDLHTSADEILKLAGEGVGITPWYYRQRLYKDLFGLSIKTKQQ